MSIIKAEPVDPYLSVAIATGRPKLEILVDDETVVKTDPDSVDRLQRSCCERGCISKRRVFID